ncbi:MAG TPA: PQQ-dependent sugar dehydrogenase [Natronosporangium sp.]
MRQRIAAALAAAALVVGGGAVVAGMVAPGPAYAQTVGGFNFSQPDVVATGLVAPWSIAFLPDGTAVVGERDSGRVLRIGPGMSPQVLGTVPNVASGAEGGLLGMAASPGFSSDGWIYAYHTSANDNRIVRFQLNSPGNPQPVLTGIPRGTFRHNGGRIAFGPDGMLYAATGDISNGSNSQNLNSLAGKILRMTPTGGVAPGNPFGTLVYSYGHRNVQGLAWDNQGRLWASEFGENTTDEVNLIQAGNNYGWPTCEGPCNPPNGNFTDPQVTWSTAEASPSGAAFANNTLFVAALRGQRLWTIPITAAGAGNPQAVLAGTLGRLRAVAVSPDGWLWVATNNRDGRGNPGPQDDRVLRYPPENQQPPSTPPTSGPPTSGPPTSGPPTSGPPQPGGCTADYQIANEWPDGFQADVTVTNTSNSTSSGWTVSWTFPDGQRITQLWGGVPSQPSGDVYVTNEAWNGSLAPNASTSFGFIGSWNGSSNRVPSNVACALR